MTFYRKKPVVIEARGPLSKANSADIQQWCGAIERPALTSTDSPITYDGSLVIPTLEGPMTASLGDFIIKGVQGEFYPCRADIFAATYEATTSSVQRDGAKKKVVHITADNRPDDSEVDQAIAEADDFYDALWIFTEKYNVPLTNNEERFVDGEHLRPMGDFISEMKALIERFYDPKLEQSVPREQDTETDEVKP
jgi:hypothetical protein